jgi:tRNA A-37 threonylcarbamoyl transferase component Bud32
LDTIGERRRLRVAGLALTGRRRRPSGERAPLPRELSVSGRIGLLGLLVVVVTWVALFATQDTVNWFSRQDLAVSQWFLDLRTDMATRVADAVHALSSPWFYRPLRWALLLALAYFKRWRAFFAVVIVLMVSSLIFESLVEAVARPRPMVPILAPWSGYSHPSVPVASLATTLAVRGCSVIPGGRRRVLWRTGSSGVVAAVILARTYLGDDHLSDGIVATIFGVGLTAIVFRLFVPESMFPVTFTRGQSAHLDITGPRGEAIRKAASDQIGLQIVDMAPFGTAGSGGSTPIRLRVRGDTEDRFLFAKLYSTTHLRSDRWYKLGRTILYGALEDEARFESVRRLVEYEDYMLLRMKEAGVPSALPFGFVEITPEREFLIVTEFLRDAEEITTAEIDDAVIDDAMLMIRRLWDAGIAHRDVKPANVLVRDGKVRLIDVAFSTMRPSPWRQAVDPANLMIILGLRTSPERVYERALRFYAPDDIAEAFAAT